jgi:hypothetical protein
MVHPLALAKFMLALSYITVQHGCRDVAMWEDVNIPVAPAVTSSEVVRGTAIYDSSDFLGMLLTVRSGTVYFAAATPSDGSNAVSAGVRTLVQRLAINSPDATARGKVNVVGRSKHLPVAYTAIDCFSKP